MDMEMYTVLFQLLSVVTVPMIIALVTCFYVLYNNIWREHVKTRKAQDEKIVAIQMGFQEHTNQNNLHKEKMEKTLDNIDKVLLEMKIQYEVYREDEKKKLAALEKEIQDLDNRQRFVTPMSPGKDAPIVTDLSPRMRKISVTKTAAGLLEFMRDANPQFFGRDDILDNINGSYLEDRPEGESIDPTKRKTVVHIINGLAGCGKSEIAIQYVKKYFSEYTSGVLWIPAGSTGTLDYALKQTYEKLQIVEGVKDFRADYIQKAITNWLEEKSDWLLVLDNADDSQCIYDYFPKLPDGGHIIITSRDTSFKSSLFPSIKPPFDVKPLRQEEAVLLLARSYFEVSGKGPVSHDVAAKKVQDMKENRPEEYEALRWLAGPDGLDGLPLALNTAIRYMKENNRSFVEYKEYSLTCLTPQLFPDSEEDPLNAWLKRNKWMQYYDKLKEKTQRSLTSFLDLTKEDLCSEDVGMNDTEAVTFIEQRNHDVNVKKWVYKRKSVFATWSLTFRKIDDMPHGRAAMELLQLCSYLTPTLSENIIVKGAEFISLETLRGELLTNVKSYPKQSHKDVQIERNLDNIMRCLRRYSLVESLPTVQGKRQIKRSFTIHRVIRKAIKVNLTEEEVIKTISCAIKLLTGLIPSADEIQRRSTRCYEPLQEIHEEVSMHVKILSRNLRQEWLESAKNEIEDPVPLLNAVALYFENFKSRPEEAQILYAKAFECTTILTTTEDVQTRYRKLGNAQCQLGIVLLKTDERKEALTHLEAAGQHYKKCCSDDEEYDSDIDVAKYHYLLARAHESEYLRLDKPPPDRIKKEIEENVEKAISISKKYYAKVGKEYGEVTAISMHELALFRLQMGPRNMKNIESLLNESLEIKQSVWGTEEGGEHVSIAIGMTDLARFYILNQDGTKYDEVEDLLLKALKMKECVLPHKQQSKSWQLGVYYLVRLYMLLEKEDEEKRYRKMLKEVDTEGSFDELFEASDPYKAYPPDVILWSRSI
ncbi:uncharacterized protein LOC144437200 [Glandiceps talaboti]